ncbi:hypothetical protein ACIRSJ_11365 [Streptomyces virginiae]|uniref:hypothetical protein n=1 Tax=Streptomyces virginiae TaxID=1961 RepID=UPI00380A7E98
MTEPNETVRKGWSGLDPASTGLLAALHGGAGGELGRRTWEGLCALVRRALEHAGSGQRARVLSTALQA